MKKQFTFFTIFSVLFLILFSCGGNKDHKNSNQIAEKHRPEIHFTPQANWMNDPNGMVYFEGEYHLFYQYYPDSTVWGPMHWGHAVSKNLVQWDHLPVALFPDSLGYIFSGSAVIDYENTSGLGSKQNPPIVAIYTYHNAALESKCDTFQYQGIAYSVDRGRTWIKYSKNPVLRNPGIRDFRDPKVLWNKQAKRWIMTLAAGDRVKFYSSVNLIDWKHESDFGENTGAHGGVWECPDLFPMKVGAEEKWVLLVSINPGGPNGGSATQYFVGNFDGKKFTSSNRTHKWLDYGKDNYAGVTWSNVPETDGRTLFIGWMSNWQYANVVPTKTWRSAATFPRELHLKSEKGEYTLVSLPVKELTLLTQKETSQESFTVSVNNQPTKFDSLALSTSQISILLSLNESISPTDSFGLRLFNSLNESVVLTFSNDSLIFDRTRSGETNFSKDFPVKITAPCKLVNNELELNLILDVASLEVFAQNGRTVMTNIYFPNKPFSRLSFFTNRPELMVKNFTIKSLKPMVEK